MQVRACALIRSVQRRVKGRASHQDARYESGLDNSPMYDGEFYDTDAHHMMMYDVGESRNQMRALARPVEDA